jgi:hypothetical protein
LPRFYEVGRGDGVPPTPMRPFFSLAFALLLAASSALRAQEQLSLDPPLRSAFPLEAGPGGIRVPYPVLLNDHTVLRPNELLRFVYIDNNPTPRNHDDDDRKARLDGPHGTLNQNSDNGATTHGEGPASAWGSNPNDDTSGLFDAKKDDPKKGKSELQNEVWTDKDLFTEAFDHATDVGTTVVYSLPAQSRPLTTRLDLPEGMLLAEVGGHIRVLGLSPQSRPYAAGIRSGDEIRSFGNGVPLATLDDFVRAYSDERHQAKISGSPAYVLNIWSPDQSQVIPVRIAAPPTIPSFF